MISHLDLRPEDRSYVRLAAAVLVDALRHNLSCSGCRVCRENEQWVFSNDESYAFSFISICHLLDLEPEMMRKCFREKRIMEKVLSRVWVSWLYRN